MLIRSLVVLSLSAALLAGCDDDEPSASTPAPAAATTPPVELPTSPEVVDDPADEAKKPADAGTDADMTAKAGDSPSWVNKVNHRCKKHQDANNKVLEDFQKKGATGPDAAADAMKAVVPLGRELVSDLREIDVPADVDQRWTDFLNTLDGAFDLMPELTKTLTSGKEDPELMKKLQDIEKNTKPFADEFKLTECLTAGA